MSLPTSLHAYAAEIDAFDKALASERGIRIPFAAEHRARRFLLRLHHCRKLSRIDNSRSLEPDHPLHGHSEWDSFVCSMEEDAEAYWIRIEKSPTEMEGIEAL